MTLRTIRLDLLGSYLFVSLVDGQFRDTVKALEDTNVTAKQSYQNLYDFCFKQSKPWLDISTTVSNTRWTKLPFRESVP